jgi:hypothetical protein
VTDRTRTTRWEAACPGKGVLRRVLPMGLVVRTTLSARPETPTPEVTVKKLLTWLALAFVIFYIISAPENSANIVRSAGQAIGDAATSLASFFESLA